MRKKYNDPIALRPDDHEQLIIENIETTLKQRGIPINGSAIIREALYAWQTIHETNRFYSTFHAYNKRILGDPPATSPDPKNL